MVRINFNLMNGLELFNLKLLFCYKLAYSFQRDCFNIALNVFSFFVLPCACTFLYRVPLEIAHAWLKAQAPQCML